VDTSASNRLGYRGNLGPSPAVLNSIRWVRVGSFVSTCPGTSRPNFISGESLHRPTQQLSHWTTTWFTSDSGFPISAFPLPSKPMLKALSVTGYVAMIGGFIGLFLTRSVLSPSPLVIAPQVAALALMIWARTTFGRRSAHVAANPTEGGLVTTGPCRFIRHPIYTAVCLFITAGAAAHLSWSTVFLCVLVWGSSIARMLCEERLVMERYPEYRQYAATTPRMIPFLF
jgi:protein-S-isoprenylcysteine O-methyltransferase Ste14